MNSVTRAAAVAAATALVAGTCACSAGLQFRRDDRIRITTPTARGSATQPVQLTWVDTTPLERGQRYQVTVDRPPQPVGATRRWFTKDDAACQASPGCPTDQMLTDMGVLTTTEHSVTLPLLSPPPKHAARPHTVTIVILNPDGTRHNEASWFVDFTVQEGRS